MARHSKEATAQSRARIVKEAARLFRLKGYKGANLDDVMRGAGLTVGTFYAHFPSKAALLAEAMFYGSQNAHAHLAKSPQHLQLQGRAWFKKFIESYISEKHRDSVELGCTLPSLISEISRGGPEVQKILEDRIFKNLQSKAGGNPSGKKISRDQILACFSLAIGAVALSRAVYSKKFSNQIIQAARKLSKKGLQK
ncbi:MAG TPA: TetR/AcrR family transcriptional regulator [bacterium]|nr:TetR/AcrR family transcriptional regulator [bacterium]